MLGKARWMENRKRARTTNTEPTLTDQAAARETDINVIIPRFIKTGQAPGTSQQAMSGDFSELPGDLREMIELTRQMGAIRQQLPPELQKLENEELLSLDGPALAAMLKKPDEPKQEEKK